MSTQLMCSDGCNPSRTWHSRESVPSVNMILILQVITLQHERTFRTFGLTSTATEAWAGFPVVVVSTSQKHIADLATMVKAALVSVTLATALRVTRETTICHHLLFRGAIEEYGPSTWGSRREEKPSSQTTDTSYDCLRLH